VLQEAVKRGINKVNTDTDLRIAFLAGLRSMAENPKEFDPRKYFGEAKDFVTEVVRDQNESAWFFGKGLKRTSKQQKKGLRMGSP